MVALNLRVRTRINDLFSQIDEYENEVAHSNRAAGDAGFYRGWYSKGTITSVGAADVSTTTAAY